jgi:tRNA G10  N-methylase Trm11
VEVGSKIADCTFGTGVFWKNVDLQKYEFLASDIREEPNKLGIKVSQYDCRSLPHGDDSLDALVFDPPYMEGFYRETEAALAGDGSYNAFRRYYSNSTASEHKELKYHDRVVDMYMTSAIEAKRVLREGGTYIVKAQDEVSANRQKLTHVEIIFGLEQLGFYCKDLFVIMRTNKPGASRIVKQEHARKRHSYFLVFRKQKKPLYVNCSEFVSSYAAQTNGDLK